jgi:hypothetical protein
MLFEHDRAAMEATYVILLMSERGKIPRHARVVILYPLKPPMSAIF